jgi:hypothetical protein
VGFIPSYLPPLDDHPGTCGSTSGADFFQHVPVLYHTLEKSLALFEISFSSGHISVCGIYIPYQMQNLVNRMDWCGTNGLLLLVKKSVMQNTW